MKGILLLAVFVTILEPIRSKGWIIRRRRSPQSRGSTSDRSIPPGPLDFELPFNGEPLDDQFSPQYLPGSDRPVDERPTSPEEVRRLPDFLSKSPVDNSEVTRPYPFRKKLEGFVIAQDRRYPTRSFHLPPQRMRERVRPFSNGPFNPRENHPPFPNFNPREEEDGERRISIGNGPTRKYPDHSGELPPSHPNPFTLPTGRQQERFGNKKGLKGEGGDEGYTEGPSFSDSPFHSTQQDHPSSQDYPNPQERRDHNEGQGPHPYPPHSTHNGRKDGLIHRAHNEYQKEPSSHGFPPPNGRHFPVHSATKNPTSYTHQGPQHPNHENARYPDPMSHNPHRQTQDRQPVIPYPNMHPERGTVQYPGIWEGRNDAHGARPPIATHTQGGKLTHADGRPYLEQHARHTQPKNHGRLPYHRGNDPHDGIHGTNGQYHPNNRGPYPLVATVGPYSNEHEGKRYPNHHHDRHPNQPEHQGNLQYPPRGEGSHEIGSQDADQPQVFDHSNQGETRPHGEGSEEDKEFPIPARFDPRDLPRNQLAPHAEQTDLPPPPPPRNPDHRTGDFRGSTNTHNPSRGSHPNYPHQTPNQPSPPFQYPEDLQKPHARGFFTKGIRDPNGPGILFPPQHHHPPNHQPDRERSGEDYGRESQNEFYGEKKLGVLKDPFHPQLGYPYYTDGNTYFFRIPANNLPKFLKKSIYKA